VDCIWIELNALDLFRLHFKRVQGIGSPARRFRAAHCPTVHRRLLMFGFFSRIHIVARDSGIESYRGYCVSNTLAWRFLHRCADERPEDAARPHRLDPARVPSLIHCAASYGAARRVPQWKSPCRWTWSAFQAVVWKSVLPASAQSSSAVRNGGRGGPDEFPIITNLEKFATAGRKEFTENF
jgi:hypothetical protein